MCPQCATIAAEVTEDARIAAEVPVIRLELRLLPALRAMDAAWVAYVKEDFGTFARHDAGVAYLNALAAWRAAHAAYDAALAAFHARYPER